MPSVTPNVAYSLISASRAHVAAVTAQLAARGYADFPFSSASLLWLLDKGGTRSTVLAQRGGVSKQAISQLVRLMEKQGYLEQTPDMNDTRAKVVRMTARGEAVKAACVEIREELNRKVAAALGESEGERMKADLDTAAKLFSELAGRVPPIFNN